MTIEDKTGRRIMKDEGDRRWWKKDGGRCTKEGFIAFVTSVIHFDRTEGTKACALKRKKWWTQKGIEKYIMAS